MIRRGLAVGMFVMALPGTAEAAVWGGFDGTRVNYAGGVLATGVDHDEMRLLIGAAGHTIAPPTPTLTAPYLAGVDVFYTSLLNTGAPVLSGAEQAALASWISSGGTLVVTGDIFPLPFYESFTSPFGITAWIDTAAGLASPSAVHPITAGVTTIDPVTQSTFQFGADALEIATADDGNPFAIVLESSTGFCDGGRVLVLGDHNLFNDNGIGLFDNAVLAANVVAWAGVGGGGCGTCGNGLVEPGESCDDADFDDTDDCPSNCQTASCGDGFLWAGFEICDDGNADDTDACPGSCEPANCGDGYVWAGMETCDDANLDDTDACLSSCDLATCGDGDL
jgi:cysteine-rich repeat protein